MNKKYHITEEEFTAIKEAISSTLDLYAYDFIQANDSEGRATSMSKETFFESLKTEFVVK